MATMRETSNGHGKKKLWVPLENNPDVMSSLAYQLGVSSKLGFHDIYSLDDADLLSYIPRPAYALLFICPAEVFARSRDAEDAAMSTYHGSGPSEPVIWFKQTIGHACGLIALLHGLCNGGAVKYIQPGSELARIRKEAVPLAPAARADLLNDSDALEHAHKTAAQKGDTIAPIAEDYVDGHHFICFVKGEDGHLWELNGGMKGPVDRGVLGKDDDALSEKALDLGPRTILEKARGAQNAAAEVGFSIVALVEEFE
ncbi:MAG: hypothetical protein M1827_006647 [Pycnora praestabilis]|nr:MAG: hypothetical protein M1827_006647 [Pycnora praestabilis]